MTFVLIIENTKHDVECCSRTGLFLYSDIRFQNCMDFSLLSCSLRLEKESALECRYEWDGCRYNIWRMVQKLEPESSLMVIALPVKQQGQPWSFR